MTLARPSFRPYSFTEQRQRSLSRDRCLQAHVEAPATPIDRWGAFTPRARFLLWSVLCTRASFRSIAHAVRGMRRTRKRHRVAINAGDMGRDSVRSRACGRQRIPVSLALACSRKAGGRACVCVCVCVLDRRYGVLNCAPSATAINSATGSRPCFCPLLLWRRIAVRG